jgi:formylglycine-generating enzyme
MSSVRFQLLAIFALCLSCPQIGYANDSEPVSRCAREASSETLESKSSGATREVNFKSTPEKPSATEREQEAIPHEKKRVRTAREGGMVWLDGGKFAMGTDKFDDAEPIHEVIVDGFWLDQTEVTNDQFAKFVKKTGYVTIAEKAPTKEEYPTAKEENLVAGSLVFVPPKVTVSKRNHYQWWQYVPGADWRHPEGPQSSIKGKGNYPVVHVGYPDAQAYAKWAGKRLPTEAEFEYAARGGLVGQQFTWGDELKPDGKWQANIWQGTFPYQNTNEDGYESAAPVRTYKPNNFGLYDMSGNVWEWCQDWYHNDYYKTLSKTEPVINPKGPEESLDRVEPGVPKRVQRGGSFLCTDQYCMRYIPGARGKGEPSSGSVNVGFRCAKDR